MQGTQKVCIDKISNHELNVEDTTTPPPSSSRCLGCVVLSVDKLLLWTTEARWN